MFAPLLSLNMFLMNVPIITIWTSPFPILGLLGGIFNCIQLIEHFISRQWSSQRLSMSRKRTLSLFHMGKEIVYICFKHVYGPTINVLKFRTLFPFCHLIKCWLSGLEFTKCMSE